MPPSKITLSRYKLLLFVLGLLPLLRLLWLGFSDELGANPVEFIEHSTGTWALVSLLLSLAITPLKQIFGWPWLLLYRRMLGLFMFFYACLHFLSYLWLDHWFAWAEIVEDISKHPYVLVGFTALMLSLPLALTSNQFMMRKLKRRWKTLHQLVYPIAILVILHYWWLVKQDITQPALYALVLAILLLARVYLGLNPKLNPKS